MTGESKGNPDRRRFLGSAALTFAAARLGMLDSASAQTRKAGANTSFASLKQIDAGVLNVGYAETGPANGRAVVLLHGWPYDIHSFVDVAPILASSGYRGRPTSSPRCGRSAARRWCPSAVI
jgi:hypothetical protein